MISIVFLLFLLIYSFDLYSNLKELGCNPSDKCKEVESVLSFTHAGFGFFGFMLALGFYILFFNKEEKTHEKIVEKLENEKNEELEENKFSLILKGLDDYEKKVIKAIKEQDGITQSTLRIRTSLSKTKLSYVLKGLEDKSLIAREERKGKNRIFLRI